MRADGESSPPEEADLPNGLPAKADPPGGRLRSPDRLIVEAGCFLAAMFVLIGQLPQRLEAYPGPYVAVFGIALALAVWTAVQVSRRAPTRATVWLIVGFAALFRLLAVVQPPSLSSDIWRYVWDGHIGASGLNPYRYAPSDPALTSLHTEYWRLLNHPTWVTMYPPLSQRIFTLLARLGADSPYAFKAVFAAVDMSCVGLILLLLTRLGLPRHRVIWYAWHPLVVMELCGSGHQDVLGIFFMLVAVALIGRSDTPRRGLWGGFGAGLSLMAKGYLLPALPIFARKRPVVFTLAFAVTVAALLIPYTGHDSQIAVGMNKYLQNRLRNAGVFAWVYGALSVFLRDPLRLTRLITTAALGLIALRLAWRPWKDEADLMVRATAAMGAFFLLSHTVYPWYAAWLVPGVCFGASGGWLLWSGLITLAYLNPVPTLNPWVPFVEYAPVLAWFAWEAWKRTSPPAAWAEGVANG